ncbi:unnamed protein product [Miscanthus lutarioriparius]|uniref:SprT-like domain-containing protein n=1 Tax=Miscanthus lutarioriparius TaxID=422564 RepID=A0A811NIH7_9POAL|nr:unnamed protein product [Miscanthus lutarioriparius]
MAMDAAVAEADLADPIPDVGDLFHHYDGLYFRGALAAAGFTAQWRSSSSPPLSRSFGSCTFSKQQNTITLSESFLKYRSCTDRKNALLHEMIHAIIYVKHHRKDRHHGPAFRAWMEAINSCCVQDRQRPDGGYNITTRHDFIPEEPLSFKGMVWKCRSCGDTLLRAINQGPPSDACCIENDDISASCGNMLCYWHNHKDDCSGTYEKTTMLKLEAPSQKKVAGVAQLLLTLPSEMSKSKGAIEESSSSILQLLWSTKATKPNAEDKHLCLGSGSNGKPQGSSSSKKADKRCRPEMVGETSVMPAAPQGKPNQNHGLVATVKQAPVSVEGYNDAKSPGRDTSKKAGKRHKPDDLQKTSVLPSAPQGTPKLKHALVATENNKLSSAECSNNAKSPKTNTSKKAGERHELQIAQKACSQPANPQKRLKQDPVAPEKKELSPLMGCSNEKLLDRSSSKKAYKQHEPQDIQETPVPSTAPGIKPMASVIVASEKQRKGKCKRKKPVKEKEYAVMSAWLKFYESDRSSGSPEPLVNKRTERRRRERERAKMLTYSRSKKIKTEPSVNSGTYASVSSHRIEMAPQDGSMQQSRPPSPSSDHAVGTTANQVVVAPATGDQSQLSVPCLDVVPLLQPADPLTSPDQSTAPDLIVISDDD